VITTPLPRIVEIPFSLSFRDYRQVRATPLGGAQR
jgi:hypothetical protein